MARSRHLPPGLRALPMLCVATVAACNGSDHPRSDGASPASAATTPPTIAVNGVLVTPISTIAASRELQQRPATRRHAPIVPCPGLPDGYDPLGHVVVSFKDSAGRTQARLTTDACGAFSGEVPIGVSPVIATPASSVPIAQPISTFSGRTPSIFSALPTSAMPRISELPPLHAGTLALTAGGRPGPDRTA